MFLLLQKESCGVIWKEKSLEPKTVFGVFIKLSAERIQVSQRTKLYPNKWHRVESPNNRNM